MNNSKKHEPFVFPDLIRYLIDCYFSIVSLPGWNKLVFILFSIFTSQPSFSQSTIKIGFLIRDKDDIAIRQAAESTIREANAQGGYRGQKFELIIRSCDGPWGMTSKQAVALIHEDQVSIVVTALDGRNAHLAEQVAAKSHVVMLSTLSSDPTLSGAYIPWYFRIVPDDRQQASWLVERIYKENNHPKVAVISFDNYDGKKSAEAFASEVKSRNIHSPELFITPDYEMLKENFSNREWDALILAGTSQDNQMISTLAASFRTYAFLNSHNFSGKHLFPETITTLSFAPEDFVKDGIFMAVKSIRDLGPETEAIRKGFKNVRYRGLTGEIKFDDFGNRVFQ